MMWAERLNGLFRMLAALVLLLPLAGTGWAQGCGLAPLPDAAFATRCTGGTVTVAKGPGAGTYRDCPIGERLTHPMHPALKRLVERLRCQLGRRLVITSGYRSPAHNLYSWATLAARAGSRNAVSRKSKHMVGKAVDFYVKGHGVVDLRRLSGRIRAWAGRLKAPLRGSREVVWIKVYDRHEGRDPDNRHSMPYLHLEMRQ